MDINSVLTAEKENKKIITKRAGRAIGVAILSCALMLIMMLLSAILVPQVKDEALGLIVDIVIYVAYLIIPFGTAKILFTTLFKSDKDFIVKRAAPKKPFLYIFGTIGLGYLLNLVINLVFGWLIYNEDLTVFETPETPLGVILTFIMIAVLPAILEEWAFRGVLLKHLRPYGRAGAIVISSFLFGLMHLDFARVIFATAFGIMLGICYDYTGSIKVTMLIHFINNTISFVLSLVVEANPAIALILSTLIYSFIGIGLIALIYYLVTGISRKRVSIIKPKSLGYKLSVKTFIRKFVLNFAIVPLLVIYIIFIILLYAI